MSGIKEILKQHDERINILAEKLEQLMQIVQGDQEALLRLVMEALKAIGVQNTSINKTN
jgi:hypothetical protein